MKVIDWIRGQWRDDPTRVAFGAAIAVVVALFLLTFTCQGPEYQASEARSETAARSDLLVQAAGVRHEARTVVRDVTRRREEHRPDGTTVVETETVATREDARADAADTLGAAASANVSATESRREERSRRPDWRLRAVAEWDVAKPAATPVEVSLGLDRRVFGSARAGVVVSADPRDLRDVRAGVTLSVEW